MTETQSKLISYAEIFQIAATHFYGDPSLIEFITDENNENEPPEMLRKKSLDARVRLSLLHSKHAEAVKSIPSAIDAETRVGFEYRRDELQAEIHAALQNWHSEPQLRDYEKRFEKQKSAAIVMERISNACTEGEITLFLNSRSNPLPAGVLSQASGARFLPKESVVECEINGETRSGIVCGDRKEVEKWLVNEDVAAGIYDTPEKRERACAARYEARLLDPATASCSKEEHYIAIEAAIPGLLRKEFESVRRGLGSKFPHIKNPGRRPNLPAEA